MRFRLILPSRPAELPTRLLWILAALLYVTVVYRTAWLSDDIFITLRSIDNFVHGHGLRWNVAERVQVYTHPLWMLILLAAYSITREPYYTTLAISVLASLLTFFVVMRIGLRRGTLGPWVAGALCLSRCYVDYSTSGLENPLSHLLAALFFSVVITEEPQRDNARRLCLGALIAGLAMVNREDQILLFAPALLWLLLRGGIGYKNVLKAIGIGALAPVAWTTFALVYYGFPFPNTAYAKLNVEIPRLELMGRGLHYIGNFVRHDPASAAVIVLGMVLVVLRGKALERATLAGVCLYVAYVACIGGDFMSGRFFSTPFLLSVLLLIVRLPRLEIWQASAALGAIVALSFLPDYPIWSIPEDLPTGGKQPKDEGVVDERLYYFEGSGLVHDSPAHEFRPWHRRVQAGLKMRQQPHRVIEAGAIGYIGYFAGPTVHIVDGWALCDPLLARIPFRPKGHWRMGHFRRKIPDGYFEAIKARNASLLKPQLLAKVYDDLLKVTQGPLFDGARFRAIYRLNTGRYRRGLKKIRY